MKRILCTLAAKSIIKRFWDTHLLLSILIILTSLDAKAQYSNEIVTGGEIKYYHVGSLSYTPDNLGNLEKLRIEIFGGTWTSGTLGETVYNVANRDGIRIQRTVMGGGDGGILTIKAFLNGQKTDIYIATTYHWAAFGIKSVKLGGNITQHQQVVEQSPVGVDITPVVNDVLVTNTYNDIGIGTIPRNRFQVNSDNNGTGAVNWIAGNFGGTAGDRVVMGVLRGTATLGAHNNSLEQWRPLSLNPDGGPVGIGTSNPESDFQIGATCTSVSLGSAGSQSLGHGTGYIGFNAGRANGTWLVKTDGANNGGSIIYGDIFGNTFFSRVATTGAVGQGRSDNDIRQNIAMSILSNGSVGIGTTNTREFKLSVNGNIRAREIKVEADPWPDYVFSKDHKLPSLSDIEGYIKENNHLPEIPSAKEVEKEGVSLGEMNTKLLKKIEELTLYMIEQEKRNEAQDKKIKELEGKLNQK